MRVPEGNGSARRYFETAGLRPSQRRHGRSWAVLTPTRGPFSTAAAGTRGPLNNLTGDSPVQTADPFSSLLMASADPTLPGPQAIW